MVEPQQLQRQMWSRRIGDGVVRSLILLLTPLVTLTLLFNLSFNPLNVIKVFLKPSCLVNFLLIVFVVVIDAGLFGKHAVIASKEEGDSLLMPTLNVLNRCRQTSIFASMVLHGLLGITINVLWLRLMTVWVVFDQYAYLLVLNPHLNRYELNSGHVFLIICGFLLGLTHWFTFHFRLGNVVLFPTTRCSGYLKLRSNFLTILQKSFKTVCRHFKFFLLFNFLIGSRTTSWLASWLPFGPYMESEVSSWPHFILNWLFLSVTAILLLTLSSATFEVLMEVFRINVSRSHAFPLNDSREEVSLFAALSNENEKYLQSLALNDLTHLAAFDKERRASIFALSQPGGHPRRWNDVSLSCLRVMDAFTERVNRVTTSLMQKKTVPRSSTSHLGYQNGHIPAKKKDENWILASIAALFKGTKIESVGRNLLVAVHENAFFKLSVDDELTNAFLHSQNAIWAIESVSTLIATSMTEDRFGVVQKRAPNVVNMLLQTLQSLDRHDSTLVSLSSSKTSLNTSPLQWPNRRREVRNALKRALYRVCDAYGSHMGHLEVQSDLRDRVHRFEHFLVA